MRGGPACQRAAGCGAAGGGRVRIEEKMALELDALRWKRERDEARAEVARLRAALVMFADAENWEHGEVVAMWVGHGDTPWTIAQEALSPDAPTMDEVAGGSG